MAEDDHEFELFTFGQNILQIFTSQRNISLTWSLCKAILLGLMYGLFEFTIFQPGLDAYFDEQVLSTGQSVFLKDTTQYSNSVYTLYSFQPLLTPLFYSFEGWNAASTYAVIPTENRCTLLSFLGQPRVMVINMYSNA